MGKTGFPAPVPRQGTPKGKVYRRHRFLSKPDKAISDYTLTPRCIFFIFYDSDVKILPFVAAAPLWGLAVLKFDVKLLFHVNDADLLRILKEAPMAWRD